MKKYKILTAIILGLLVNSVYAQKYITKEGTIEIFSQTSLFTIEAKNQKVASVLNAETGDVVASTLVRSFKFKEALVEEHFNENYMESHLHPKSIFKGKIVNWSDVNISKNGEYTVTIEGTLTMHGEDNPIKTTGTLIVNDDKITAKTTFKISLASFKIEIEESYKDRIQDKIELRIHFDYSILNR